MDADTIIVGLASLSKEELAKVKVAVEALTGMTIPKEEMTDDEELLFQAMSQFLVERGFRAVVFYDTLRRSKSFQAWKRNVPQVSKWFNKVFADYPKKVERFALAKMGFKLLADYLQSRQTPVSLATLAVNVDKLPECFANAFPGYIQSGLVGVIVAAMKKESKRGRR